MRNLAARAAMMAKTASGPTYELCDYVSTDGSAYIDLGWKPTTKVGFEIVASGEYTGFSSWAILFGALNSSSSSGSFYNCPLFFGSMFSDRLFCYKQGLGTNGFWEKTAYGGRVWLDGNFNTISIPYENPIAYNITTNHSSDTVNTTTINTISEIAYLPNEYPINNLTAFAVIGTTGTKYYQVPASMNMKVTKIAFSDSTGVIADFRAAKQGTEFGLANIVDQTFHGGIGGTILGE